MMEPTGHDRMPPRVTGPRLVHPSVDLAVAGADLAGTEGLQCFPYFLMQKSFSVGFQISRYKTLGRAGGGKGRNPSQGLFCHQGSLLLEILTALFRRNKGESLQDSAIGGGEGKLIQFGNGKPF